MRVFGFVFILFFCLFITQTTEGQLNESNEKLREIKENKKRVDHYFREFSAVMFIRNQACLEQYGGTQYFDLMYDECKSCESLENSHQRHILCPEYQLEKANTELEKADKELEKKFFKLFCIVHANHNSYYDEETDECVSCDNCEIGKECQMICAGSKGADPASILWVILIILAIVSPIVIIVFVIIVFVVRYTVRKRRSARDPQTDISSLSSESVESSMGNTTCAGDKSSGYIPGKAVSSSCHLGIVDQQNETSEESTVRKRRSARDPQTDGSTLSSESAEIDMGNTTCAEDIASGYITGKAVSSSGHLGIVDQQNDTGYPLLKPMKEKHKKEYEAHGKHDPPMFDLYPKRDVPKIHTTNPHPDCSKLRDACKGEITQKNAAALIAAMQEEEQHNETIVISDCNINKHSGGLILDNARIHTMYMPAMQEEEQHNSIVKYKTYENMNRPTFKVSVPRPGQVYEL